MANSYVTYTGNGATTAYSVPFPYIFKSHVKVYLNNVLTSAYTWTASNTITFATAPPSGQPITIMRRTQSDPLVDFTSKSRWQTSDLNLAIRQSFYLAEEAEDAAGYVQAGNGIELSFGADGKLTITNIGTPGGGSGNVIGPVSSVNGNIPVFSGPSGRLIADSGVLAANVVQGPVSSVNRRVAIFSGSSGKVIADGGKLIDNLVEGPASSGVLNNIPIFSGPTGKIIADSGVSIDTLFTQLNGKVDLNSANTLNGVLSLTNTSGISYNAQTGLGIGYGARATIVQSASKSTSVTINSLSGRITMNGASLAANTTVSFQMNNNQVADTDQVLITFLGSVANVQTNYRLQCAVVAGIVYFTLTNLTAAARAEAVEFNFAIFKG